MELKSLVEKIKDSYRINAEEALALCDQPLEQLCSAANELRQHFCGNAFDICTIVNGKSGHCSENCKYCAQSAFYKTEVETYPLLPTEEIVAHGKYNDDRGVLRYSIVTSGRALSDAEVDRMCESVRALRKETGIAVCVSFGLLKEEQFAKLVQAGAVRAHNNLETSRRNFPNICTTHSFEDKVAAIQAAQAAGMQVCSGGIMGLGETMEDRIDMVLTARELGVKSIPVNMLNPIPGTPYEHNKKLTVDEMRQIVAIFRFLIPDGAIRLAGGRGLMPDKGRACFQSGANAAISGDMLTTAGITIEQDFTMLAELGYQPALLGDDAE